MNRTVVIVAGLSSILTGSAVMAGWLFDIPALKSVLPVWVTMKFVTALAFVLSGFLLLSIESELNGKRNVSEIALPVFTLCIGLLMSTLLFSVAFNIRTGMEDLFVRESPGAVKTTIPGRPSLATIAAFGCITCCGLAALLKAGPFRAIIRAFGAFVALSGVSGASGYLLDAPALYFSMPGLSTAMAVHTAIVFIFLGAGLCVSARN